MLACGLSGPRRLRYGPLRDRVLEVRFVTGDGRVVRGGGPTVKNVTGYDLPRLFVGSLGTLGVIVQVTLRTQPRAECSRLVDDRRDAARRCATRLFRPATLAWDGRRTYVRLEGYAGRRRGRAGRARASTRSTRRRAGPRASTGAGISVRPRRARRARRTGSRPSTAPGSPRAASAPCTSPRRREAGLAAARAAAEAEDGWLLREAGAPGLDPFGSAAAERGAPGPHQGRVRSHRQAEPGPAPVPPERRVTSSPGTTPSWAAAPRRGRARRLRVVRAVPARVPDLPRHRPRDRVTARTDRGDARGRARRRADRRRVHRRDGCLPRVSRLRGRVPVRRAVRSPHGGRPHRARAATVPRAAGSSSGSGTALVLPHHALLLALTWLLAVAQMLRLVPKRLGLPKIDTGSLRDPLERRSESRHVPLHRLRHGRVATRGPSRRAAP